MLAIHLAEINAAEINRQPINGIEIFSVVDTLTLEWALLDRELVTFFKSQCFSWQWELSVAAAQGGLVEATAACVLAPAGETVTLGGVGVAGSLQPVAEDAVLYPSTLCGGSS